MNDAVYLDLCGDTYREYVSNSQLINDIKHVQIMEGPGRGLRRLQIRTACGLGGSIVPDRGMDIASLEYKSVPLSWMSRTGLVHQAFFTGTGKSFERSFLGGFLTTCGLTQAGAPCIDQGESLSLHGRFSNIPSFYYSFSDADEKSEDDICVKGKVRETTLYEENLLLSRTYRFGKKDPTVSVSDIIRNEGYKTAPIMILYHFNFHFPIIGPKTKIATSFDRVQPLNEYAEKSSISYDTIIEPSPDYLPENFRFTENKEDGWPLVEIQNHKYGLGITMWYNDETLGYLTMWKMLAPNEYVIGFEPGNCLPEGRCAARKNNRLQFLEPGEEIKTEICFLVKSTCP